MSTLDPFAVSERAADTLGVDDPDVIYDILEEAAGTAVHTLETPHLVDMDEEIVRPFVSAHSRQWLLDQCMLSAAAALDEQMMYIPSIEHDSEYGEVPYLADPSYDVHRAEWPDSSTSPLAQADDLYAACSEAALKATAESIIDALRRRDIIDA